MKDIYESPLATRYASREMLRLFSPDYKFTTWRRLWCALAESEQELGLPITDEQLAQLRAHIDDIDYDRAAAYESELRHDVMAHIRTYADACPAAAPILHWGATSCYVDDNGDILQMREALRRIRALLANAVAALADFAARWKDTPTLAYTHLQAAQPTTVGKRAALWLQDLLMDCERLEYELDALRFPGCKGTTGTAASFLALFDGDREKVAALEVKIAGKMGFDACLAVSGQTYSRKVDVCVLNVLSGIAVSCAKMATDLRLLAHLGELDEPAEPRQVGSSAMAYKRNPMRCERIVSLSRYLINTCRNAADTAAAQWLERTLDDSANRRLAIPEAFLTADAILRLAINVISGAQLYPLVMERHLRQELPFLATENILMDAVRRGGSRQELHEAIRVHARQAAARVKGEGADNDLLERLAADPRFALTPERLREILDVRRFIGCAPEQTECFLRQTVAPVLEKYQALLGLRVEIDV